MPGAWAALRPELATPRGADTNYYDQRERLSQRKFPSQSAGGRTTPRAGTASHRSSNRRQQNQTPAAEQLWEQAERSLRAEDSGYDHKWEDQSSSFMHEQPQPYQQPPPPPLPYQQPAYTTMPSPGVAVGQAPAQWAGDHSRSPLPIARSAVRASSLTPTPRADQVIILSGGESHPTSLVQLWRSNAYSDVDVIVEGQAFYAHRLVLAAGSEFLSSLVESSPPLNMRCASVHRRACCAHAIHRRPSITFHPPPVIHCMPSAAAPAVRCVSDSPSLSSRVSASQRRASVLELPGVTADAFEIVLEWLYCGEVSLVPHMLPKSPLASCASMAFADCPSCFSIAQVGLVPHMLPGLLDAAVRLEVTSLQVRHLPTPPHIHAHLPPSMAFRISDPSTPISHLVPSTPISHLVPSTPISHLGPSTPIPLQGAVARALEDNLNADTCLLAWEAAEAQGLSSLAEAAKTVALREFDALVHSDAFAVLPPERLRALLADPRLDSAKSEMLVGGLVSWLSKRQSHSPEKSGMVSPASQPLPLLQTVHRRQPPTPTHAVSLPPPPTPHAAMPPPPPPRPPPPPPPPPPQPVFMPPPPPPVQMPPPTPYTAAMPPQQFSPSIAPSPHSQTHPSPQLPSPMPPFPPPPPSVEMPSPPRHHPYVHPDGTHPPSRHSASSRHSSPLSRPTHSSPLAPQTVAPHTRASDVYREPFHHMAASHASPPPVPTPSPGGAPQLLSPSPACVQRAHAASVANDFLAQAQVCHLPISPHISPYLPIC